MEKSLKSNTKYVKLFFFLLTGILICQLFYIQVIQHDTWSVRSSVRNELRESYQAARGQVLFADGSPLAVNEDAFGIFVLPENFNGKEAKALNITHESFANEVSSILGLEKQIIQESITKPGLKYVSIANKISKETLEKVTEKFPLKLNIWTYEKQAKRVYPAKQVASKLIGFVGKDDDGNDVGRYGIEEYFDGVLRGTDGLFEGKKDKSNQVIVNEEFDSVLSKSGIDITLTIDRGIQVELETQLMYWLNRLKAREATAVIMEPGTGKIIAAANVPTYDPNVYWKGELIDCTLEYYSLLHNECNKKAEPEQKPEEKKIETDDNQVFYPEGYEERLKEIEAEKKRLKQEEEKLKQQQKEKEDPNKLTAEDEAKLLKYPTRMREIFRKNSLPAGEVYRNAANSYTYEPGSVIKVITLAIAYENGVMPRSPAYQLGSHRGCEEVADVTLCTSKKLPKSQLTVEEMLKSSDNIGALRIAEKVSTPNFVSSLEKFGLGKKTGVELADETVFQTKEISDWSVVDKATASFGQGNVSLTPIQLTNAWNILASEGKSYKPTLIKEINDNGQVKVFEPQFLGQVADSNAVKDAVMVNAAGNADSFTKAKDFYSKYTFSGKTGTANIPNPNGAGYLEDVVNMSFVGFAPVKNPKFTMLLWFREPRIGADNQLPDSVNAAQIPWLDIAEKIMLKMNVAPLKQ